MFIKEITLPNKRITTNLGFGCASLMSLKTNKEREQIIKTAINNGILHFDLARFYGLGEAEKVFSLAIGNCSKDITISSKFGINDKVAESSLKNSQELIRKIINKSDFLKQLLKKIYSLQIQERNYETENFYKSLSLTKQALNTNYLDLYFIHEPLSYKQLSNNIFDSLIKIKFEKIIGSFGISGNLKIIYNIIEKFNLVDIEVIQYEINKQNDFYLEKINSLIKEKNLLKIRFGLIRKYLEKLSFFIKNNPQISHEWSNKLNVDLNNFENLPFVLVASTLSKYPNDLLLYSSTKVERLRNLLNKLNDPCFSNASIKKFVNFYDLIILNL